MNVKLNFDVNCLDYIQGHFLCFVYRYEYFEIVRKLFSIALCFGNHNMLIT